MDLTVKDIRQLNLEKLIKQSGFSKGIFAQKVETAPAYISQILSKTTKRSMGDCVARKIETRLGKPKGWMDCLHDADADTAPNTVSVKRLPNIQLVGCFETGNAATLLPDDEALLAFITEVDMAAAPARTNTAESPPHELRFSKAILEKLGIEASAACCIAVYGNSMAPVLPEGAIVAIDTGNTAIKDGDIYAISHAGKLRVKMIYSLPGGGIRLRSFNSEEWPDEHIPAEQTGNIQLLGRVFWWSVLR